MRRIKCITFDKAAQDNLSQEVKDKMKADRLKAQKEQEDKGLNVSDTVCPACYGAGVVPGDINGCYNCAGTGKQTGR